MKFLEVEVINPLTPQLLVGGEVANLKENKKLALSCQAVVGQYMQSERRRKESPHCLLEKFWGPLSFLPRCTLKRFVQHESNSVLSWEFFCLCLTLQVLCIYIFTFSFVFLLNSCLCIHVHLCVYFFLGLFLFCSFTYFVPFFC